MTPHIPRRDRSPDPVRDHLKEVRRGLLRLHKALIDAERAVWERETGPVSNGRFLQALIEDPFFAWLRPFSGLIAAHASWNSAPACASNPVKRLHCRSSHSAVFANVPRSVIWATASPLPIRVKKSARISTVGALTSCPRNGS